MNEETIIEKRPVVNGQTESTKESSTWKHVTLGGVSGILMGAGLLYAGQATAATIQENETDEETPVESVEEAEQVDNSSDTSLPVAKMHNEMSFGEAFEAARAEVGPGGVFIWHGGIYNTYSADEWNAMTSEQRNEFAQKVNPEINANDVPTPTDEQPNLAIHAVEEQESSSVDVQVADTHVAESQEQEGDVHIVGYGEVEGHLAVGYDTDNDGQADVAIIDIDDSGDISSPDVIVSSNGNVATVGEVVDSSAPDYYYADNPEVAPDMPDYMNDANTDDMNFMA